MRVRPCGGVTVSLSGRVGRWEALVVFVLVRGGVVCRYKLLSLSLLRNSSDLLSTSAACGTWMSDCFFGA